MSMSTILCAAYVLVRRDRSRSNPLARRVGEGGFEDGPALLHSLVPP